MTEEFGPHKFRQHRSPCHEARCREPLPMCRRPAIARPSRWIWRVAGWRGAWRLHPGRPGSMASWRESRTAAVPGPVQFRVRGALTHQRLPQRQTPSAEPCGGVVGPIRSVTTLLCAGLLAAGRARPDRGRTARRSRPRRTGAAAAVHPQLALRHPTARFPRRQQQGRYRA